MAVTSKKSRSEKSGNNPSQSQKTEILSRVVDRIMERRTFEPYDRPVIGCRFHRFRIRGEKISGTLGWPIANFRQGTSYPLALDTGEIVEVVANALLHKQIRKGELCGRYVEIQYMGRDFTNHGRSRKIYRVFRLDDKPMLTQKDFLNLIQEAMKKYGNRTRKGNVLP